MRVHLLAVGQKMPRWVRDGYLDYADRLRGELRLELKEISPGQRRDGCWRIHRLRHRQLRGGMRGGGGGKKAGKGAKSRGQR